jgi:hypothetical protein
MSRNKRKLPTSTTLGPTTDDGVAGEAAVTTGPDDNNNGAVTGTTAAPVVPDTLPVAPSLKYRIDLAEFAAKPSSLELSGEEEGGSKAKWEGAPATTFVRAHSVWMKDVYTLDCRKTDGIDAEYVLSFAAANRMLDDEDEVDTPRVVRVVPLVDRDGIIRFWPIRMGPPGGLQRPGEHVKTAMQAVARAREGWVKITWKSAAAGYRTKAARVAIPDPVWPPDLDDAFAEAVRERYINDPNHKIILKCLGEA